MFLSGYFWCIDNIKNIEDLRNILFECRVLLVQHREIFRFRFCRNICLPRYPRFLAETHDVLRKRDNDHFDDLHEPPDKTLSGRGETIQVLAVDLHSKAMAAKFTDRIADLGKREAVLG